MRVRAFCLPFLSLICTIAFLLPVYGEPAEPVSPPDQQPKTDLYGDPLPPGAIARMGTVRFRHEDVVYSVAFSPDGKMLASGSNDETIRLWEVATGKELRKIEGHQDAIIAVAFSPDGKTLASGSRDRTIRLWEVATSKELHKIEGHQDAITAVAFSLDGKTLASGSGDKTVRLWEAATGKELLKIEGHEDAVLSVAFSPDGKTMASGSIDRTICLWVVASGKKLHKMDGRGEVISVAFSPDGKMLASGGRDSVIRLWEVATGIELHVFKGHHNVGAFSSDGKTLASGGWGETIRLWEVATGKEFLEIDAHGGSVYCATFSPDNRILASGLQLGTIVIWDLEHFFPIDSAASKHADAFWDDLARDDALHAFAAILSLTIDGSAAVHFLRDKLKPNPIDKDLAQRTRKAIDDLNHESFEVREKAEKELLSLSDAVGPVIQEVVEKTPSAEMKARGNRIFEVINRPFPIPTGDPLRRWRAIQVLERIGSKEAREVLEMLEKESPSLRERRESKAALERLDLKD